MPALSLFGPPSATLPSSMLAHALEQIVLEDALLVAADPCARAPVSAFSIDSARPSFSTPSRVNTRTSITVPSIPGGTRRDVSFTSEAFSPKMARSSFSSGVSWVSPFGVTLPTRMSPARTSAPMKAMPASSSFARAASPTFGMSSGDFLGSQLGIASHAGQLFDVDRGEAIFLHHALGDEDRVLEVVAVPRHERDQQVLAQRELARGAVDGPSASTSPRADRCRRLSPADAG